ncbi:hypothetical protein D3C75_1036130 [compost metagenome]
MSAFVLRCKIRPFKIAAQHTGSLSAAIIALSDSLQCPLYIRKRSGNGGGQPATHTFTRFVDCQPLEDAGVVIHHINPVAAVNMNVDVSWAKQFSITHQGARRNRLYGDNRFVFNA